LTESVIGSVQANMRMLTRAANKIAELGLEEAAKEERCCV
jgi:hypothetical protein